MGHCAHGMDAYRLAAPRLTVLTRRHAFQTTISENTIGEIENFGFPDGKFDLLIHLAAPSAHDTFTGMTDRKLINCTWVPTTFLTLRLAEFQGVAFTLVLALFMAVLIIIA